MLARAIDKHDNVPIQKGPTLSQQLFPSSSPRDLQDAFNNTSQFSQSRINRSSVSSLVNALKPNTSPVLNGPVPRKQYQNAYGTKRMSNGLAATLSKKDSFQETSQSTMISDEGLPGFRRLQDAVYFDENDFDDDQDLDLDGDDQGNKETASEAQSHPALPISHPVPFHGGNRPQSSSAPVPWSSSPLEHRITPQNASALRRSVNTAQTQGVQSSENLIEDPNPRPTKRRTLPWLGTDGEEASPHFGQNGPSENMSGVSERKQGSRKLRSNGSDLPSVDFTPLPKDSAKSPYPWNKTASAVKEEQKRLKQQANTKLVKNNDGGAEGRKHTIMSTKQKRVPNVFLSDEQKRVVDLVAKNGNSVFFTGSAGTGKSVLLREIIRVLRDKFKREPDRIAVTASTGLAACNVGGVTLHSFGGIGLGKEAVPELVKKIKKNQKARNRWLRTKVLIVDEISMVDGELFDKLESIARIMKNNGRPFGGIQLIITGDFFQLPPVPDHGKQATFAFDAATWNTSIEHTIGLNQVFRQKDPMFADMLNEMRLGKLTQKSINTFRTLNRPIQYTNDIEATELFSTRNEVENANNMRMRNLIGKSEPFLARDGGAITDKSQRDKLLSNCMAPQLIELKKGAQVMLIKNIDDTLVNGSLGKVIAFMDEKSFEIYHDEGEEEFHSLQETDIDDESIDRSRKKLKAMMNKDFIASTSSRWPLVRFIIADGTSRDLLCQPEIWKIELPNGEIQASRTQIPLILAWALSIHKAQGQTLERVKVDLGKVFEKGQAYVALSRATCQEGLQVLRFDPKKVMAHDRVREFYNSLYSVNEAARPAVEAREKGMGAKGYEGGFPADGVDDEEAALLEMGAF